MLRELGAESGELRVRRGGTWLAALAVMLGCIAMGVGARAAGTGPWDIGELKKPPAFSVIQRDGNLTSIWYDCEPWKGKPTKVFAYVAYPREAKGKSPGIVLVHGGGGKAFPEWARMWADRGYVAIAMDLEGHGPNGVPVDWPVDRWTADPADSWVYHSVAAVMRGVSLLSSLPEVDPKRIGITGISWGGYLTSIVSGLDDRLKVSVPVYGCGFIYESASFAKIISRLPEEQRKLWVERFDPSTYLGSARMPMLFVNGATDFHYWMPITQKSCRLAKRGALSVQIGLQHSHQHGWAPAEIEIFINHYLKGAPPLASVSSVKRDGARVEVTFRAAVPVTNAALNYTTGTCDWPARNWQIVEAQIKDSRALAELPAARPITWFVTLKDERGAIVSTECEVVEE